MKKLLALMLAAMLLLGCIPAAVAEDLPYVELTMYLVGDKPDGVDAVYEKINEILKEKVNATVKVEWLSWAEESTKYSLLFSGGEDFDMIFTASQWCHFEQTVGMEGFAELTPEMLEKYAPDVWASWPETAWKQATINGGIYMIPANFVEVTPDVVALRGDLMKQYGYEDINSYEQMIKYFEDCTKGGVYGFYNGGASLYWLMFEALAYGVVGGTPVDGQLVLYNYGNPEDAGFYYVLDWEPFITFCHDMKRLADEGCWPSDVMNSTADRQDGLLTGRGAAMVWNSGSCQMFANQANATHPEWEVNLYNIMPDITFRSTSYINGGIGFNAESDKLERALMVYNQFATNPEIQNLAQLGIEGVNWVRSGENGYMSTETPYNASNYWGWRNLNIMLKQGYENPTVVDEKKEALDAFFLDHLAAAHPLDGFTFNQEPVSVQCAAIDAIKDTYFTPLMNGLVDDVDQTLSDYRTALDHAGMQDVLAELQRQIEEYLAQ